MGRGREQHGGVAECGGFIRLVCSGQPPGGRGAASNSFIAPNKLGGKIPLDTIFSGYTRQFITGVNRRKVHPAENPVQAQMVEGGWKRF